MRAPDLTVFRDPHEVARAAAERFYVAARVSVRDRGRFVVALAGGSTPRTMHQRLGAGELRMMLPWSRTWIAFGDERCVPPTHEQSNYRMVRETLFDHVRLPPGQVLRIEGEHPDPDRAAREYETRLRRLFPGEAGPRIDLLVLGMGDDGHTASLFPGATALDEHERWVVATDGPGGGPRRITLTLDALRHARQVLFLITGRSKAPALARAFGGSADGGAAPLPASLVVPFDGAREILVDRDAASELPGAS